MALLLAQPQHVTPMWVGLAEAINRWLWRWSPWHLRLLNTDLADQATRWRRQLRESEWENQELHHRIAQLRAYICRDRDFPQLTGPAGSVVGETDEASQVRTLRITAKAYCFSILSFTDFEHACRTEDVLDMVAEDYAQRFSRDLKHRIKDELRALAAC